MDKRSFGSVDELPSSNFRARWRQDGKRVTAPMTLASERDAKSFLLTVEADLIRGKRASTNSGSMTLVLHRVGSLESGEQVRSWDPR